VDGLIFSKRGRGRGGAGDIGGCARDSCARRRSERHSTASGLGGEEAMMALERG
jgi:hypothetical protein